jgi:hypothetical protein
MPQQIDLAKLDRRVAERLIKKGELSAEAWEKHLASLEDAESKGEPVSTELEQGVIEGR